jgi:predicted SAM-dependent methyltransferase
MRKFKEHLSFFRRKFITPKRPANSDSKIWLHIGCGEKDYPGFVNIDARPFSHVHIVKDDITELGDFESESVDLVYMCHILEHFRRDELKKVLKEIWRILHHGGILRISVPDFDKLLLVYELSEKNIDAIINQLMGGQDNPYNIHYSVFTEKSLTTILQEAGFNEIQSWSPWHCKEFGVNDRSMRRIDVKGQRYPISLNLDAIK